MTKTQRLTGIVLSEGIDITPTWSGILPALLLLLESGSAKGRTAARDELARMAKLADIAVANEPHYSAADPFRRYAEEVEARGGADNRAVGKRIRDEGRICRAIVDKALSEGLTVSVNDGEEWTVRKSSDRDQIIDALMSTDADILSIRHATAVPAGMGRIWLVYGNEGHEVINDYSTALEDWLAPIKALTDDIEAGR